MNEQDLIRDIVDGQANKQVKALESDLDALNKKFQDSILGAKQLNDALAQSKGYSEYNKNSAAAAKAQEQQLKLIASRQLQEEKLAAFRASEQTKADARATKEEANLNKIAEANNKAAEASRKRAEIQSKARKTIISDSQAEVDAYNKSSANGSGGANADGTTVNRENIKLANDTVDAVDRERISIKPYTDEINKNTKSVISNSQAKKQSNLELEKEKLRLAANATALKNLAKEQIAEKGSLDQRRAALNRLRTTFDALSAQERQSPFGQRLSKTIPQLNKQVLELEQATGRSGRNVGNYGSAFDKVAAGAGKAFGALRFVANILPGVGIAGLIAFASEPIIEYISKLDIFAKKIDLIAERAKLLDSVKLTGTQNAQAELTNLRLLFNEYTNSNLTLTERKRAYDQLQNLYPSYFKNIKFEKEASEATRTAYDSLTNSILASARARAGVDKIVEIEKTKLDNETKRIQLERENLASQRELAKIRKDLDQEALDGRKVRDVVLRDGGGSSQSTAEATELKKQKQNLSDRRRLILDNNKLTQDQARIEKYTREQLTKGGTLTDLPDVKDPKIKKAKDNSKQLEEIARKNAAALIQIEIDSLKEAQGYYQKNLDNQNFGLDGRLESLKNFGDVSVEIEKLNGDKEKAAKKLTANEILAVDSDTAKKQQDIRNAAADKVVEITRQSIKRTSDAIAEQNAKDLSEIEKARDVEIKALVESFNTGAISQETYAFRREQIEQSYTDKYIALQIEQTKAFIEQAKLRGENTEDAENKLASIQLKYSELRASRGKKQDEEYLKRKQEQFDLEKQIGQEVFSLTNTLIKRGSELRLNALQDESDNLNKKRSFDIEQVNDSVATEEQKADKIAIINARADAQQQVIDQRVRQEKIKQAKADKAAAIAQALINGALAMTKVAAQTGVLSFAFSPLIAALTAVQIATIIAQPIPKYKDGKNKYNNYSGPAIVGDGGMKELVVNPDGSMWVTPNTPTLTNVQSGTEVISGPDFKRMLAKPNSGGSPGSNGNVDLSVLVAEQRKSSNGIIKALKNQTVNSTILTEKGLFKNKTTTGKISDHISRNFGRR